jgi:WD40 repeat protein
MGWQFNSCPITRLRAFTLPHSSQYSNDRNTAAIRNTQRITAGPSYLARIGSITDRQWREQRPTSHLLDQHAQVSGPVVRTNGAFIAWTVGNQVKWTNGTIKQWPVFTIDRIHLLRAHDADLTDLTLSEDAAQQARITVASVDGSIACWRVDTHINNSKATTTTIENIDMNQPLISRHDSLNLHAHQQLEWRMFVAGNGVQRIQQRVNDVPHRIISVSHDMKLRVIDDKRQTIINHTVLPTRPWAIEWLSNDVVAVGLFGYPNSLAIYRLRPDTVTLERFLPGHRSSVYGLDSCPLAPTLLLSGGYEGQTRLWDLRLANSSGSSSSSNNRACVGVFEDRFNDSAIYCCQWDGQRVASGRVHHGMVSFWDARWPALTTQCQAILNYDNHIGSGGDLQPPQRYIDTWTKYNGNRWTPVYSLCLEQTRVLAALDTELWWLNFTDNMLTLPTQSTVTLKHAKQSKSWHKHARQPRL